MEFAEAVKELRVSYGAEMYQEPFARMLGISLFTVSRWETGHHHPKSWAMVWRLLNLANQQYQAGLMSAEAKSYFKIMLPASRLTRS